MKNLSNKIYLVNEEIDLSLNMGTFTVHKGDILFFYLDTNVPGLYKIYLSTSHTIELKSPNLPLAKLPNSSNWEPFINYIKKVTDITTEYNRNSKLESILNF